MKEFLNGWAEAPDGVKLFFVMCVLTMIICLIAAVYLGWKEADIADEWKDDSK